MKMLFSLCGSVFGLFRILLLLGLLCFPGLATGGKIDEVLSQVNKVDRISSQQSPSNPRIASKGGGNGRKKSARVKKGSYVELQKIQHLPGDEYTRVVLLTSEPVVFEEHAVRADLKSNQPAQIYVDLKNCVINPKIGSLVRLTDAYLADIRLTQLDTGRARVVIGAKTIDAYRVFSLSDPFRVIIDVRGNKPAKTDVQLKPKSGAEKSGMPSLARQLSLDVKRIVLDPGHGGRDKGAISPNNTFEKDITLSIALELKKILSAKQGYEVILTRTGDKYMSLEDRTAMANARKADIFISIHTNAHTDRSLCGTETYFLNFSKDTESARVAALENATSTKKISDLEAILHDLMLNTKIKESAQLATEVQNHMVNHLRMKQYEAMRDLGIKQAPFCVLIGAEMPSILIETAFLTNQTEERRLKDSKFRRELAKSIAAGIESYIQQIKGLAKAGDRS